MNTECYTVADCEKNIKELRIRQVQIESRIEKQEENDVFDDSLYDELDKIENDIEYWQKEIDKVEA